MKPAKSFCHRWLNEFKRLEYDGENVLHYSTCKELKKSNQMVTEAQLISDDPCLIVMVIPENIAALLKHQESNK